MTASADTPPFDEDEEVLIVAARKAWPLYTAISAYICQNRRFFRPVRRMGFYAERRIYPAFPLILDRQDDVEIAWGSLPSMLLSVDPARQQLGRVAQKALDYGSGHGTRKVLRLTAMHDPATLRRTEIPHKGGTSGWVMGQRYARLGQLMRATTTEDLA